MLKKLITIICHPSYIGFYFLDKFSTVFLWVAFFFVISTSLIATKDLLTPRLSHQEAINISDSLLAKNKLSNTIYKDKQLNGNKEIIDEEEYYIIFNDSAYANTDRSNRLILVFSQSEAHAYISGMRIGKVLYQDLDVSDFTFSDIKDNHDDLARIRLESFIMGLLKNTDMNYRSVGFFSDFFYFTIYYLGTVLLLYFGSIFKNGGIEARIRRKLVLYDTIIYFVFFWFRILFNIYWLSYVGIFISLIYMFLTFSRIKKVTYKKEV